MGHSVSLSKEVKRIKPKLTKRFLFVSVQWSLFFPAGARLLSQCAFIQFHAKLSSGFLNEKHVDDQTRFMEELDGNILPAAGLPL